MKEISYIISYIICFGFSVTFVTMVKGQVKLLNDTCLTNDFCETAFLIQNIVSDSSYVCTEGCTIGAQRESFSNPCGIDTFPTVWFKVITDDFATNLNVRINSTEIEFPILSIFLMDSTCTDLKEVDIPILNNSCRVGVNWKLAINGIHVSHNSVYLIAVSSMNVSGGHFQLCASTFFDQNNCVQSSDIEVKGRSYGGNPDGPFLPGETIDICMNVNAFSAEATGCQWFQGLIPLFGDNWDLKSFDENGQPAHSTINGDSIGVPGNGLYGAATWDWFNDVGYHHTNNIIQIGDRDGNGTVEMCSTLYENCPNFGGISGGCCGPCWTNPGQILPPGWFAYGINGTCPTPGHPTVDWGDGNTCGEAMGPWSFCFSLSVKSFPECLLSNPTSDLDLGIYTTADGETGSWTGGPSICINDKPQIRHFKSTCGTETKLEPVDLHAICSGDSLIYFLSEPGVIHWYWSVETNGSISQVKGDGLNETTVEDQITNTSLQVLDVIYHFKGILDSAGHYVSKDVSIQVFPPFNIMTPDTIQVCFSDTIPLHIYPDVSGGTGIYEYDWRPFGTTTAWMIIPPPFQSTVITFTAGDDIGCMQTKYIHLIVKPDCFHTHIPISTDESNEKPTKGDTIAGGGIIGNYPLETRSTNISDEEDIKIYPIPASDFVQIEWLTNIAEGEYLVITDLSGKLREKTTLNAQDIQLHHKKMNIEGLASGVYIISFQSGKEVYALKLVKI